MSMRERLVKGVVMGKWEREYSQGIIDREATMECASQVTRQAYPDADCVYVDDYTVCEYRPDGTSITWSDGYMKVLTEKGKRYRGNMSFPFTQPYMEVKLTSLEVIGVDGQVRQCDTTAQSKTVLGDAHVLGDTFAPGSRILRVRMPSVNIGDVIRVVTRHEILKPLVSNAWSHCQALRSVAPIRHAVYEVHAPTEEPLRRMALKDIAAGTVVHRRFECQSGIIYRWELANVPSLCSERDGSGLRAGVQRLVVSTLSDWQTISRWYWRLCLPHLDATTPELDAKVAEVTKHAPGQEEKAEAIFSWVSRQVQYTGMATDDEAPGWEPRDAAATFRDRCGLCRDKAALLVSMLRRAGCDAYPALVTSHPWDDTDVPHLCFNHVIVAVRADRGRYDLVDCTHADGERPLRTCLTTRGYLIAHPDGETLRTSSPTGGKENG